MENTKNKLPVKIEHFFHKMSNYIDEKIYFYGSIQRNDYIMNSSDIDICIFTDNVHTMNNKLQHFLHLKKSTFKKIMWTVHPANRIVYGYKIKYTNKDPYFQLEVTIYNEKYKNDILKQHALKTNLPFYIVFILMILKMFYYNLKLMDKTTFIYYKNKIMNKSLGHPDNNLVIISPDISID